MRIFRVRMLCVLLFAVSLTVHGANKAVSENPEIVWKVFLEKHPVNAELAAIVINAEGDYFREAAFSRLVEDRNQYAWQAFVRIFYDSAEPFRSRAWSELKNSPYVEDLVPMFCEAPRSHKNEIWEHIKNLKPQSGVLWDIIVCGPEPYKKYAWELLANNARTPEELATTPLMLVPLSYRDMAALLMLEQFPALSQGYLLGILRGPLSYEVESKVFERFIATGPNHDVLRAQIGFANLKMDFDGNPLDDGYAQCEGYSGTVTARIAERLLADHPSLTDVYVIRQCAPEPYRETANRLWLLMKQSKDELLEIILKSKSGK